MASQRLLFLFTWRIIEMATVVETRTYEGFTRDEAMTMFFRRVEEGFTYSFSPKMDESGEEVVLDVDGLVIWEGVVKKIDQSPNWNQSEDVFGSGSEINDVELQQLIDELEDRQMYKDGLSKE
jgi:hypothetical protein